MKLVEYGVPEEKLNKVMNKKGIPEGERKRTLMTVRNHIENLERWETAPTIPEDLSYLHRLVKYGGRDERMKKLMSMKNVPEKLWDANIGTVRNHIRESELWESKPILQKDLTWLLEHVRFGMPESELKKRMGERNIPQEIWETNIAIVNKYIEDQDIWEALQSDEEGGGNIVTLFQQECVLFWGGCGGIVVRLFLMVLLFASTCPIRSGAVVIDNSDQSGQVF